VTKEEFIGRAADAILRAGGFDPDKARLGLKRLPAPATDSTMEMLAIGERLKAIEKATAALEAVGAWRAHEALALLSEVFSVARAYLPGDCSEPDSLYMRVRAAVQPSQDLV
jgi:hypothetical protein